MYLKLADFSSRLPIPHFDENNPGRLMPPAGAWRNLQAEDHDEQSSRGPPG
jgi:hypothetical protein